MRAPSKIGRYELKQRVGAGGMGVVYEAYDSQKGQRVALKVLLPHAAEEAEGILRFKREFRALARLRHKNIVQVFDAGIEDDIPFIAMEFLEGKDVRAYLQSVTAGTLRDHEMVKTLRQIFAALSHIHARRIVHRDLKPENILVTADGRVKLMDFGVARLLRAPTDSSGLLGTFAYMAPEQVTTGEIDGRSDLYAIGVILFELLTGKYPFPIEPPAAALHHHVNTPPQLVRHIEPNANPTLAALAHRLLEKDPMDRLQSAEDAIRFLADSEAAAASLPDVSRELPGLLFVPRFVAREDPLDELEGLASDASGGRGKIILLEGPSGVGKSRLIEEVRIRIRRRTHVLVGQCSPEGQQAYNAVEPILDTIASIATRAPRDVVHRIIGRDAALVAAVSPRLASFGGRATAAHLDANERKIRLHKAIVGVIGRLALTRPVVLMFDDVHWADALTIELLWDAARTLLAPRPGGTKGETVCPVAIVVARRSPSEGTDAAEMLIRRLDSKGILQRMSLTPLGIEHVAEMVRTMCGMAKPSPVLIQDIMEASQGLPLLVQEVIHQYVRDGVLVRNLGAWRFRGVLADMSDAARPTMEDRPSSVPPEDRDSLPPAQRGHALAIRKLESLGGHARRLVERLALLGRLLPSDLVAALSGLEETAFLDAIDELVRGNVLVEEVSGDGVRYRFHHEGFREALVRGLPKRDRQALHLEIARILERRFRDRRPELAHVLGRHFRQGGQPERALRYLVMVAESAAARGDLDGAMRRLSDARAIIAEGPPNIASGTRLLRLLLREIELLLDFGRASAALERADPQAAVNARNPKVMAAELMLRRATCHFAMGKLDETLAALGRLPRPAPNRAIGVRALSLEGRTRVARGEHAEARAVLEAARDIARGSGLDSLLQSLEARIGVVMLHQGEYDAALAKLERVLGVARKEHDTKLVGDLVGHIGLIHAARNNTMEALSCYREALEIAEARGVRSDHELWSGALGMLMTHLEDYDDAEEKLTTALTVARETGNRQGEAKWRGELGIRHFHAGDIDRASAELNRCLAIAREIGYARYEGWAQVYIGAVGIERDLDKLEDARDRIESGLEIARDIGNDEIRIVALLFMGRLRQAEGDLGGAEERLAAAEALAAATQNLRLQSRVKRELDALSEH